MMTLISITQKEARLKSPQNQEEKLSPEQVRNEIKKILDKQLRNRRVLRSKTGTMRLIKHPR